MENFFIIQVHVQISVEDKKQQENKPGFYWEVISNPLSENALKSLHYFFHFYFKFDVWLH